MKRLDNFIDEKKGPVRIGDLPKIWVVNEIQEQEKKLDKAKKMSGKWGNNPDFEKYLNFRETLVAECKRLFKEFDK